jgi:polyvinyl alcohol dehydrogenase (cytochrome)
VYSLDAATGCVYWSFEAKGGVRTAISLGTIKTATGTRHAAYFGDLKANVFAIDAETGALIWTHRVDTHPFARVTGAPALANGRLYVPVSSFEEGSGANDNYECCTFRGSVAALRRGDRQAALADLHGRSAEADAEEQARHAAL